jgi:spermidine synthase
LFGFVLLPVLGGMGAGKAIALAALILALLVLFVAARPHFRIGLAFCVPALLLAAVAARHELDYGNLSSGANVYFYPQHWGKVVDHTESIDGGLTAVSERRVGEQPVRTLLTNGKFQGNDSLQGEMQAQIGFAVAPLLHTAERTRALVIGYGTGVTSRVLHEAGFRHLEIAELSADIVNMADRYFGAINREVSAAPGVTLQVTDGRNLLLLSDSRFDLVSIEITSIWFAGAASLYNREFYRLAKQRLTDDGVLQQWLQLHRLSPADILTVIATLRTEFRYVSLYVIGQQGILVATDAPDHRMPTARAIAALGRQDSLADVRRIAGRALAAIADDMVLTPEALDRFIAQHGLDPAWLASTDNNLLLEYSTPKANANDPDKSYARNISMLRSFATVGGVPSAADPD